MLLQDMGIAKKEAPRGTAVALGMFDGVHVGHKAVVDRIVAEKEQGRMPVVVTFEDSPAAHVGSNTKPYLTTPSMKKRLLEDMGVSKIYMLSFQELKDMDAEDFILLLHEKLHVKTVCCGYNFRFGKNRDGDQNTLLRLRDRLNIKVQVVPPVQVNGGPVSSTRIRSALQSGNPREALEMLGRRFWFDFPVSSGDGRGRKLGSPTINQIFPDDFVRPRFGVYATVATVNGRVYPAVSNIGVRPTYRTDYVSSETHILQEERTGFSIKGQLDDLSIGAVKIELVDFLRDERKFPSAEALREAIQRDIIKTGNIFRENSINYH